MKNLRKHLQHLSLVNVCVISKSKFKTRPCDNLYIFIPHVLVLKFDEAPALLKKVFFLNIFESMTPNFEEICYFKMEKSLNTTCHFI